MTRTLHCYLTLLKSRFSGILIIAATLLVAVPQPAAAETFSGTLNDGNMMDEYMVTMPSYGTLLIQVTTGPDLNLYGGVFLFDSDGETSFYGTNQGPDTTIIHTVQRLRPGQYRLVIEKDARNFYFGDYSVSTSAIATQVGTDSEFNDDAASALQLELDTPAAGLLGYRGQQIPDDMADWYKVSLPAHGDLTVTVSTSGGDDEATGIRYTDGELNLYGGVFVYDADGTTAFFSINQGPGTTMAYVVNALRPGTYFVRLEIDGRLQYYWGSYTVTASALPWSRATDPEPNDDLASAVRVAGTTPVTGDLGTRGQGSDIDYKDYWVFAHPGGELALTVRTSGGEGDADSGDGELNLYGSVSIYNSAGDPLSGTNQGPGTEISYTVGEQPPGDYYLLLEKDGRSFYWGTYAVSIDAITDISGTDDADSDSNADTNSDSSSTDSDDFDSGATDSGTVTPVDTTDSSGTVDSTGWTDSDSNPPPTGDDTDTEDTASSNGDNDETDAASPADCGCKIGAPLGSNESGAFWGLLLLALFGLRRRRFR